MGVLPKRKPNRLSGLDYSQNGAYFITLCVKDRRNLLGKIVGDDAHIVPHTRLSRYGMAAEKYISRMDGVVNYVIMPNHIHMLILVECGGGSMWASTPTQSVPQRVKSLKTLVSKETGASIFQRSFHDHVIRNEQDYLEIWRYIDENPLKWQ